MCIALAVLVGKKVIKKSLPLKITGGLAVFLIMLLLPVSDEIVGRIYFNHLCETEAGVKVYQTIELPAEYWDENGKPKFLKSNGDIDRKLLGNKITEGRALKAFVPFLGIKKRRYMLKNISKEIAGENIDFFLSRGWVIRNFTTGSSSSTCNKAKGKEFWHDFYSSLFEPANISGQE
jgi:hypothetical protein